MTHERVTLLDIGCVPVLEGRGLANGSTMQVVLERANLLLNESVAGSPPDTVRQVTAMAALLGRCVNQE